MDRNSMQVGIKQTGRSSWEVTFCYVTQEATIDGTLEMGMKPGYDLTQEVAEAYVWKNRDMLLRYAKRQVMCEN